MRILRCILKYLIILVFLVSIYNIVIYLIDYSKSKNLYNEIREEKKEDVNLDSINSDYVGWIRIENTSIDYPIMQSDNNEFYLKRDFNKEYSYSGSIFMDYRNSRFQDKNTIIYGHHMKAQSMFGPLKKFKDYDYFKKNRYIYIYNKDDEEFKYEVFGVYITKPNDTYCLSVNFNNDENFDSYIKKIKDKSMHNSDIEISSNDKILTLYTCSYEFKDARLVIHAKLIS